MIELALGLFLAFGAYALGTSKSEKKPDFNIELCAKSCNKLKSYDNFKQRCECE